MSKQFKITRGGRILTAVSILTAFGLLPLLASDVGFTLKIIAES